MHSMTVWGMLSTETQIISALRGLAASPGRMRILSGIKDTVLLDDTYNASPASTMASLELLARFPQQNKIAVLGDMLAHAHFGF